MINDDEEDCNLVSTLPQIMSHQDHIPQRLPQGLANIVFGYADKDSSCNLAVLC